ncbi:serine hydrolase domain-containing protein [Larkinella knui]|uniref:Class A beta-lactamase-related serine hydrolase n=1 Tax=Larkinella knui TaxID=2025310 RepID=A0A3P1CDB8_9BACT|nr:serine hydrolase domain-containing protein [Larkinella knui]RRB10834.1 class A beta-lactamase-related serine hydrolase [Larkinella knui]
MKNRAFWCYMLLSLQTVSAQKIETALDSVMHRNFPADQPGGALLVVINGKTVYNRGFGVANLETKTPISPETNSRMASVSKQFTAMCILLLEKQKKLSVDDNLLKFFPEFNQHVGKTVKLRHLLTHTSGILDYESVLSPTQKDQIFDNDVVNLLKAQDSTYFEPGSRFRYSNSAFCLLAQVVERVSGKPYLEFITATIFKPLGMNQTTLYEPRRTIPNRAMGYARGKDGKIRFSDQSVTSGTKGDGCVYTSLTDYKKWNDALTTGKLVDLPAQLSRVHHRIEGQTDGFYGLGWFFTRTNGDVRELFHSGSTCGFSNCVVRIPEKRTLIVLFSNLADNHRPFADILNVLKSSAALAVDVWALHNLTN